MVVDKYATITTVVPNVVVWQGTFEEEQAYLTDPDRIVKELTAALEVYYDSKAKERRYDNRLTCALRAGYAGPFQAEGAAFAIWMDTCNEYAYGVMADVLEGTRAIPTAQELISELGVAPW